MRLEHGRVYVHQDANWNVMALTDLTGSFLGHRLSSASVLPRSNVRIYEGADIRLDAGRFR